jgi:hypothetical protein
MQQIINRHSKFCFIALLLIQIAYSVPIIPEEIVIDYTQNNNNNNGSIDKLIDTLSNSDNNNNNNNNNGDFLEEFKINDSKENIENDQLIDDKTYYIVKASPLNKRLNKQSKDNTNKQKKIFKIDKNLQRLEKKSWKIPIKSLALYNSEHSKDSQAPQKMMDELADILESMDHHQ